MQLPTMPRFLTKLIDDFINKKILYLPNNYRNESDPFIFDFSHIIAYPELHKNLTTLYCNEITRPFAQMPNIIVPVDISDIPITTMISTKLNIPMITFDMFDMFDNIDMFDKNTSNLLQPPSTAILITGVIKTHAHTANTMNIITKLRNMGVSPIQTICLLKMSTTSLGMIHGMEISRGIVPIKSLLSMKDLEFNSKIKKGNICITINARTISELESEIAKIHRNTSIIKFNIDLIQDFDPTVSVKKLIAMKNRYGVLLWESRIFCDKLSVIRRQITQGIHNISSWASIVSVHPNVLMHEYDSLSSKSLGGCKIIVSNNLEISYGKESAESEMENHLIPLLNIIDPLRENILTSNVDNPIMLNKNSQHSQLYNSIIGFMTNTNVNTNLLKITLLENITNDNPKNWADLFIK